MTSAFYYYFQAVREAHFIHPESQRHRGYIHPHTKASASRVCFVMETLVISSWRVSDNVIIKRGPGSRLRTQSELQAYKELYFIVKWS